MKKKLLVLLLTFWSISSFAAEKSLSETIDSLFQPIVEFMASILFWNPVTALGFETDAQIPIVVVWLIIGAVFFTIRMKFVNIRAFKHGIDLVRGKYSKNDAKGEVSHFQALATALSGTIGLGNIASVAVAISIGGAGATFWMIIAGLLGMSLKFTECTLGVKYREIGSDGKVYGGPMYYLKKGLAKRGLPWIGKCLACIFALIIFGASLGGGNMFQSNQAYSQLITIFPILEGNGFWFGVIIALIVSIVIIGGIKGIAKVTSRVVPLMAGIYVIAALSIILINYDKIGAAFGMIWEGAFNPDSIKGGIIGVLILGFQRGAFSNEAGVGSASIAHSAVKTKEPITEGIVALLEPFIDTVIVCTMTALVIIITGFHNSNPQGFEGAQLTSAAFESVYSWFPYILLIAILLFAFSTMITWAYYGLNGFHYVFNRFFKSQKALNYTFYVIFLTFTIIGASSSLKSVIDFSDMMILSMAFPNILGLYFMAGEVKLDLENYLKKIKNKNKKN